MCKGQGSKQRSDIKSSVGNRDWKVEEAGDKAGTVLLPPGDSLSPVRYRVEALRGKILPPLWMGRFITWLPGSRARSAPSRATCSRPDCCKRPPRSLGPLRNLKARRLSCLLLAPGLKRPPWSDTFGLILPILREQSLNAAPLPDPSAVDPQSEAFRRTEAELIQLLGGAPLDDPIEDF